MMTTTADSRFDVFSRETQKAFGYLVTDFGFERPRVTTVGYECMITFRKADRVAVTIAQDAGAAPWVMLTVNAGTNQKYRSEELALDVLITARCPRRQRAVPKEFPISEDQLREIINHYATALRDCGTDVVRGEVTSLRDLRRSAGKAR